MPFALTAARTDETGHVLPRPPGRRARMLWVAVGVVLTAAVVAFVGPAAIVSAFAQADLLPLALAVPAYAAVFLLRGVRWRLLLRDVAPRVRSAEAASLTAMGWMANSFLPFKAGDAARAAIVARRQRTAFAGVLGSVALERVLDLAGLAAVATLGLLALSATHAAPPSVAQAVGIAWVASLLAGAALIAVAWLLPADRRRGPVLGLASRVVAAARDLARTPRRLPAVVALTLAGTLGQVLVIVLILVGLLPTVPWTAFAPVVPLFLLSFAIAVTPGHVATYEAALVATLALAGLDAAGLLPVAVAAHLISTTIVVLLGGAAMALHSAFVRDQARADPVAPEAVPAPEARP